MHTTAADQRSTGVDRQLVAFAERERLETGRGTMQLEVWYLGRGRTHRRSPWPASTHRYTITRKDTIHQSNPHRPPLLAMACDFVIYHENVRASG
jgi:hypothetical protein